MRDTSHYLRSTNNKSSRGVQVVYRIGVKVTSRNDSVNDFVHKVISYLLQCDVLCVLH